MPGMNIAILNDGEGNPISVTMSYSMYQSLIGKPVELPESNNSDDRVIIANSIWSGTYSKDLRVKLGLSQQDVASMLSISQSSLSNFENGVHKPSQSLRIEKMVRRILKLEGSDKKKMNMKYHLRCTTSE
jgi:DNA-binding transcriptional regulator YiaG